MKPPDLINITRTPRITLSVPSLVRSFVRSFLPLSVCLFVRSFVRLFVVRCIRVRCIRMRCISVRGIHVKNTSVYDASAYDVSHSGYLRRSHDLSARRARRTKSRGLKGLQLEVRAWRAPRLLVSNIVLVMLSYEPLLSLLCLLHNHQI